MKMSLTASWPVIRYQIRSGKGPFQGKWWIYVLVTGKNGYSVQGMWLGEDWQRALDTVLEAVQKDIEGNR